MLDGEVALLGAIRRRRRDVALRSISGNHSQDRGNDNFDDNESRRRDSDYASSGDSFSDDSSSGDSGGGDSGGGDF